ncbi:hypothetical protein [Actinoplanes sp. NPDC051494]|uniref:hypothetical protein n=1 Tax=Actinoplanes sp. NPDC051494 TaxID=3363907 RepID=UPI0037AD20B6
MGEQPRAVVREDLDQLLKARMLWPPADDQLVTLLRGPAGSGKTTLLADLEEAGGQLHLTRADLGAGAPDAGHPPPVSPVGALLATLVLGLMTRRHRVLRLSFPRCVLGLLAIQIDPGPPHDATRRDIQRLLTDQKRLRLPQDVHDLAVKVADAAMAGTTGTAAPGMGEVLVSALTAGLARRRTAGERWWTQVRGTTAVDTLLELNTWIRDEHGTDRWERSHRWLIEAFLADLRASFPAPRPARPGVRERDFRAVVLLDNAERGAGPDLLRLLCLIRTDAPPVTVIATTGRRLDPFKDDDPASARERCDARVLSRLTRTETHELAELHGHGGGPAGPLHEFTHGHPGGLDWLLTDPDRLRHLRTAWPPTLPLLARLLPDLVPGRQTGTARERPADTNALRRLVRAAAAEQLTSTIERRATMSAQLETLHPDLHTRLVGNLWADDRPGTEEARLDPFLRRLLLVRLAEDPRAWDQAHRNLETYFAAADPDDARSLYHALARNRIKEVAGDLGSRLDADDATTWLARFDATAGAPNAHLGPEAVPVDALVLRFCGVMPPGLPYELTRLLTGEWLRRDPLRADTGPLTEYASFRHEDVARLLPPKHAVLSDLLLARAMRLRSR